MKKALQLKTVMFILRNNEQSKEKPQHQQDKIISRIQNSPSHHSFKGHKLDNKPNLAKSFRKLSHQTPERFKTRKNEPGQPNRPDRYKCSSLSRNRYEPFAEFTEQGILHSKSNLRLAPFERNESSCTFTGPQANERQQIATMNWGEVIEFKKGRMKSEPTNSASLKNEIMKRISKKLDFMRKMTLDQQTPNIAKMKGDSSSCESSKLFNFDRLYEHCLKKINRGISIYQKDTGKDKDRKYYEMKIQSTILSNQLKSMRRSIAKKKQNGENDMGVIGNLIDISKVGNQGERINSQRGSQRACITGCGSRANASAFKKKLDKITKNIEGKNPFKGELYGWEIGCQKQEQFQISN